MVVRVQLVLSKNMVSASRVGIQALQRQKCKSLTYQLISIIPLMSGCKVCKINDNFTFQSFEDCINYFNLFENGPNHVVVRG